jgi:hypothetical protein
MSRGGRRLVGAGGQLNTRLRGRQLAHAARPLASESPSRPEIAEEIRAGLRTQKGKIRGKNFWQPTS